MTTTGKTAKAQLRAQVLQKRRALTPAERSTKSAQLWERIYADRTYREAQRIFIFLSMADEVQTDAFITKALQEGKEIAVPLITGKGLMQPVRLRTLADVEVGVFGIRTLREDCRECLPPAQLDVILVPGAAFTSHGERLGMGGGYYDRFMAQGAPQAKRIAVAFQCQICPQVPTEVHDVPVQEIYTESAHYLCADYARKE